MSVKRIGRNPKTKECYIIHPRRRFFFRASNKLKKDIKLMKRILIPIFLIFSFNVLGQEFDEDFLESLPEDIVEDVVSKGKLKEEIEKPVYRKDLR